METKTLTREQRIVPVRLRRTTNNLGARAMPNRLRRAAPAQPITDADIPY